MTMIRFHKTIKLILSIIVSIIIGCINFYAMPAARADVVLGQKPLIPGEVAPVLPDFELTCDAGPSEAVFNVDISWPKNANITVQSQTYAIDCIRGASILSATTSNPNANVTIDPDSHEYVDIAVNSTTNPTHFTITVTYDQSILNSFFDIPNAISCHGILELGDGTKGFAVVGQQIGSAGYDPWGYGDGDSVGLQGNTGTVIQPHAPVIPAPPSGPQLPVEEQIKVYEEIHRAFNARALTQPRPPAAMMRAGQVVSNLKVWMSSPAGTAAKGGIIVVGAYEIIDLGVYIHTGGKQSIGLTRVGDWIGDKVTGRKDQAVYVTAKELARIAVEPLSVEEALAVAEERAKRKGYRTTICDELFGMYMNALAGNSRILANQGTSFTAAMDVISQAMNQKGCYQRRVTWLNKDVLIEQRKPSSPKPHEIRTGLNLAQCNANVKFIPDQDKSGGASPGDALVNGELAEFKMLQTADSDNIVATIQSSIKSRKDGKGQAPFKVLDLTEGTSQRDPVSAIKDAVLRMKTDPAVQTGIARGFLKKVWFIYKSGSGKLYIYKQIF